MPKYDAVFVGLTVLDIAGCPVVSIPEKGSVAFLEQIRMNPAGTAAGANLNAAKLGIHTAAVGCVGHDEKADFILSQYAKWGIDCSLMQRSATRETSTTILPIRPNGERPCLHYRGASDDLFVGPKEFDAVLDTAYLHLGGTGLLASMDQGQSEKLLAEAKARGVVTSFDLIHPGEGALALLKPLLPYVDYFMPSMEEASALCGGLTDPTAVAKFFFELGVQACVLKDGTRGSWLVHAKDHQLTHIPCYEITPVDTTGCGDAYCGGFLAGLAKGLSEVEACKVGSAVAALVASGLGSDAGVKNWEETLKFMEKYPSNK